MKENKYDNDVFFEKYSRMDRSKVGLSGAGEWSELQKLLPDFNGKRVLDLGCGYGFLSIASQHLNIKHNTLTDNNAAALISAQHNCRQLGLSAEIIASDAGQQIDRKFDLILCNPPFHQGFSIDGDLTDKFLANAKRLLSTQGTAYFVVNQFIALEKKAQPHFKSIKLIAQNKSFKVIALHLNGCI